MSSSAEGRARRRVAVPLLVGAVALVIAVVLAVLTLRSADDAASTARDAAEGEVETRAFVSREGGFRVRVPTDLQARRVGPAAHFVADDRSLVVSIGPVEGRSLADSTRRLLASMRETGYRNFRVTGRTGDPVRDLPARTAVGRARNSDGVPVRFVAVVIDGGARNYAVSGFTHAGSDPAEVLPRLHAVVNSFRPR